MKSLEFLFCFTPKKNYEERNYVMERERFSPRCFLSLICKLCGMKASCINTRLRRHFHSSVAFIQFSRGPPAPDCIIPDLSFFLKLAFYNGVCPTSARKSIQCKQSELKTIKNWGQAAETFWFIYFSRRSFNPAAAAARRSSVCPLLLQKKLVLGWWPKILLHE